MNAAGLPLSQGMLAAQNEGKRATGGSLSSLSTVAGSSSSGALEMDFQGGISASVKKQFATKTNTLLSDVPVSVPVTPSPLHLPSSSVPSVSLSCASSPVQHPHEVAQDFKIKAGYSPTPGNMSLPLAASLLRSADPFASTPAIPSSPSVCSRMAGSSSSVVSTRSSRATSPVRSSPLAFSSLPSSPLPPMSGAAASSKAELSASSSTVSAEAAGQPLAAPPALPSQATKPNNGVSEAGQPSPQSSSPGARTAENHGMAHSRTILHLPPPKPRRTCFLTSRNTPIIAAVPISTFAPFWRRADGELGLGSPSQAMSPSAISRLISSRAGPFVLSEDNERGKSGSE